MKVRKGLLIISFLAYAWYAVGQNGADPVTEEKRVINGQVVKLMISGTDTLYIADLQDVHISSPRQFKNYEEYRMYMRYKRYAADVYPYAKEAIEVYRQIKEETEDLKRGKRKKYIRSVNKEYKNDYKETFKNMTRLQGKVMIKMIERELDVSFFDLIKEVRGGFTATYWDTFSRLYGYRLRDKYEKGEEPILDAVLQDFNITAKLK
ncbi:MAG TPA: DUF4294 domain-containing protein [Saprospiraceae bacterium]|nr:DUF4294 domain-containing protein [Saprospiraceae bacterium]HNT20498.1 DUF4294 domain-containing protein [Saprospiraceae bacterium]